ncbi:TetR/AcrR family transcriptional regulator [Pseudobutyrivibrio sp.]|uniref:TetR/AcrR family transcriptional regulator n=1 Tax=Pseudobutyrivibrio sp. TaxID=2014367 RepID=UPI001DD33868|nr:TetR/AcrR family transcriptional regulator [Pseudobutyrivibrio sp.]MBE5910416.1 TetR/AcrR family transcriptional regulator [Pseudobutyrivibrio sp.]
MSEIEIKKEDGRVRYTKMRIRSALYELIQERSVEKITVTAICKRADINRATFYKHYLDVQDLIDKLQEETIQELSNKLNMAIENNPEDFIIDILKYLKANIDNQTIAGTLTMSTASSFTSKISSMIYQNFSTYMNSKITCVSDEDKNIVFAYIAAGCAGIIDYWIKGGYKESEEIIASKLTTITSSTINYLTIS